LPVALKNAIIDTTVVSGHGPTSGETNFTSTDKLYLLSTKELLGKSGTTAVITDDSAEVVTRQLDYYAGQNVTTSNSSGAIKQKNGIDSWWWLRSADLSSDDCFFGIDELGEWGYSNANYSYGVAPAFRIA
jgi:hypothetical protein